MTSIQEKSLGCIVKAGSRTINEVVGYGQIPTRKGVVLMDGPGYDLESITGVAASGCQFMIFTTGRGTPVGYPIIPVIKVASTSRMYQHMADDMDINAGVILEGEPMEEVKVRMIDKVKRVLNGELTKAEMNQEVGMVCLYTSCPAF